MKKIVFLFLLCALGAYGEKKPDSKWLDQKFSMFIHWGIYSELGGVWEGKPITQGYSEQIQSQAGIFGDWYAEVADRFYPVCWNADSIVTLARRAGMKSIVFTSKHHDGFCMYHSRYTDYNIVDATPFKRDVMKELAEACRKQGMRFGVYFSLIDWHFPQAYPISSHNADPLTPEHYIYNLKQVEEIMTGYGDISEIWFDMGSLTSEQSRGLYHLVDSLQPSCMISGRLGNDCSDFSVLGDNEYPDDKIGVPWQTAASFFDETWGYRSWQKRGEVAEKRDEKLRSLIKVVSRGGNYLLNIGPKGDGSVVPFEQEVLEKMGSWLGKYGEGVYGVRANPFEYLYPWQDITVKGNRIYIFADKSVSPVNIRLDGLRGQILSASYVGGGPVTVRQEKGEWQLFGQPCWQEDSPLGVICLEMEDGWKVEPVNSRVRGKKWTLDNATPLYAYSCIDYYTGFRSTVAYTWGFQTSKKQVKPVLYYTDNERGRKIRMLVDGVEREVVLGDRNLQGNSVYLKKGTVKWGRVYTKPSGSVFGNLPAGIDRIPGNPEEAGWKKLTGFQYGKINELGMRQRKSLFLYTEIESDRVQRISVELGSGNGILVLLNGREITAHLSEKGKLYNKESVVLPLQKGKNQLVIKLYNRFEKKICFSIKPEEEYKVYKQEMGTFPLEPGKWHRCEIRPLDVLSKCSAMRLNNIELEF